MRPQPRQAQQHPADADARKAMLIKILVIGVVLVAISGIIGFGMENMSSGWLYSVMLSFRLNNATVALAAKVLFWLSLGTVVVSFAMLQQVLEK